jgi:hypothetical protein
MPAFYSTSIQQNSMDTRTQVDCDKEDIFKCIRKASLIRHISYTKMRLTHSEVSEDLPEILAESKHFQKRFISQYEAERSAHNSLLARGMNQGLSRLIPAHKLICPSLDSYLLRLHSDKIADILESLTAFAQRVSLILNDNHNDRRIALNRHLLMHRRHWRSLSRQVLHLIRQICICEAELRKNTPELWPNWSRLQSAAKQAALVYARMMPADARVQLAAPTQSEAADSPAIVRKAQSRSAAFLAQRHSMMHPRMN